ncbi:MAG TPA: glutathione synthase [Nocardioidaceae bacterium]|nr:glutathione synthase [Nocardioidaceae bacterium]
MRTLFVVDPIDELDASTDTSIGLMHAAQELGAEVWVAEARGLEVVGGRAVAQARQLKLAPSVPVGGVRWAVADTWYDAGPIGSLPLEDTGAVFIRVEPPVDLDYLAATYVLDLADPRETALVNAPGGLRACSEHLVGLAHPDLVPPTLVTARPEAIRSFLDEHGAVVVKPVDGFSGRGVFLLRADDPNLASILDTTTFRSSRSVIVQPYLADVESGNKRVFVLDGVAVGATLRHPVAGDFRIASPDAPAELTDRDVEIVSRLAPALRAHGLRCVGLDVIGDHLIEVNVTSPGALRKADALLGTTYCTDLVSHVLDNPHWKAPS